MKKMRVMIVEDEPLARNGLRKLLGKSDDLEVVAEAANGAEALAALRAAAPDLVLLDIQMPGMSGLQFLEEIPARKMPLIIFCTAHDEYAIKAFELHAVDYLLKPFGNVRFAQALDRARATFRAGNSAQFVRKLEDLIGYLKGTQALPAASAQPLAGRIAFKADGDVHFFDHADIIWIEGHGDYLKVHGRAHSVVVRETMIGVEAKLDSPRFMRVHKSAIANLDHVRKLKPVHYGDHALEMDNDHAVRIGRAYREKLNEWIKQR